MNDKFKKQLKEAILELLISRLDEQGPQDPKISPKIDPVVQRPRSTYTAPKTTKPAPAMPRSVGSQAVKSGVGKLLGRGASKLIPGIGVALGAYDIYDMLSQPDPNPPKGYGDTPRSRRYGNYMNKPKAQPQPQTRPEPIPSPAAKKVDTVKAPPTAKSTIAPVAAAAAATLGKAASKASTKSSKKASRQTRKPPKPDIPDSDSEEIKEPSKFRNVRKRTIGTSPKTGPTERVNRTRYK